MEIFYILAEIFFGITIFAIFFKRHHVGTLRVDCSDPTDAPYMFLELSKNVGNILNKKYVILKVNPNSYVSHK